MTGRGYIRYWPRMIVHSNTGCSPVLASKSLICFFRYAKLSGHSLTNQTASYGPSQINDEVLTKSCMRYILAQTVAQQDAQCYFCAYCTCIEKPFYWHF